MRMTSYLLKVLQKFRLLSYVNIIVRKNGISIPILGRLGLINYYGTEKWMTFVLQKLFTLSDGCFVDVGVNVGQTLIKVRGIDKELEYIGFEPNPVCIFYTEKLIQINKFKNCQLIPAGISDKSELIDLKLFDGASDSMATIIDDFNHQATAQKTIIVIDSKSFELFNNRKIGILKVDVEGAEINVLLGLDEIIRKDQPIILLEILPACTKNGEYDGRVRRQAQIEQYIRNISYSMFRILKNDDDTFKRLSEIEEIGKQVDWTLSDYLLLPRQLKDSILKQF